MQIGPSYSGSGLVNLMAEIEHRLTGESPFPPLDDADLVPEGKTYVLVLFDGLGIAQMSHHEAGSFRSALAGQIASPFPSTTNVSLATVASGLSPSQHGQVAHLTWYPDLGQVVNTLKWVSVYGDHIPYEYGALLPRPNLWERLRVAGAEPITVQPGAFQTSPLSRAMYRGARFEGAWDSTDLVDATLALAAEPGRFVFTYVPFVDVAGHVYGQGSDEFAGAMREAALIWDGIVAALPPGAVVLGTADHGLIEVGDDDKILVRDPRFDSLRFAGDPRGVYLWGDDEVIDDVAALTGGQLVDPLPLLGPDPSGKTLSHVSDHLLLAPPGKVILPKGFDKRLRCYHGGLSPDEVQIPLLVG